MHYYCLIGSIKFCLFFQGSFRQSFVRLMVHVRSVLAKSRYESIGFSAAMKCPKISVRMREGGRLLDLAMLHRGRYARVVRSQLFMIAVFLGVVSQITEGVGCGGVRVNFTKTLDRCPGGKIGVHHPFYVKS